MSLSCQGCRRALVRVTIACTALLAVAVMPREQAYGQSIMKELGAPNEQIEMTVNSSRILTLDVRFKRAQVNNPEMLRVTPLSTTQMQISALTPGVTQVNLWDENEKIYTVDVVVFGDTAELERAFKTQWPNSSVKVHRYSTSLVLSGFVDRADDVSHMTRLAEDYATKIINNISVGGVQQIVLNVKVMEVSRTKLRQLGFDFSDFSGGGAVVSSISGLITGMPQPAAAITGGGAETLAFGIADGNTVFMGFLDMLRQYDMMKILAEPKLVTVSGRPASFIVGGEFPILVPQSLGTVSIEYKKFGTQVEFMPLVLGNGNVRLEIRPRVSEIDNTRSVVVQNTTVPGLRIREVDTAVEMKAGQTLALAGLIQTRTEASNRGFPWLSDLPWVGVPFRRVREEVNEIELLMLVRPEFVDALDPDEVQPCGPGEFTESPSDIDFYFKGKLEVPKTCGPCAIGACGAECGDGACVNGACVNGAAQDGYHVVAPGSDRAVAPQNAVPAEIVPTPDPAASRVAPRGPGYATQRAPVRPQPPQQTMAATNPAPAAAAQPYRPATQFAGVPQPRQAVAPQAAPSSTAGLPGMIGGVGYETRR